MTAGRSPQPSLRAATSASPLHSLSAKGHFGQAVGCRRPGASSRATCDSTRGHSLSRPPRNTMAPAASAASAKRETPERPRTRRLNIYANSAVGGAASLSSRYSPAAGTVSTVLPVDRRTGFARRLPSMPHTAQRRLDAAQAAWLQAVASFAGIFGLFLCWSSLITSTNCSRSSQASCVLFRRSAFFAVATRDEIRPVSHFEEC